VLVFFDAGLSMWQHVSHLVQTCFFHLRGLRFMRRQLGRDVTAKLVSAIVFSTTATLFSRVFLPRHLQLCKESCTQQQEWCSTSNHGTPALCELHWLLIAAMIDYKLCLLVHETLVVSRLHCRPTNAHYQYSRTILTMCIS